MLYLEPFCLFVCLFFLIQTVAFKSKHALPNESHSKEILIRRHTSIRRSLRPGSFQTSVSRKTLWLQLVIYRIIHLFFFFYICKSIRKWEQNWTSLGAGWSQYQTRASLSLFYPVFILLPSPPQCCSQGEPKSHKYFSLPAGKSLDSKFPPGRLSYTGKILKLPPFNFNLKG